MKHAVYILRDPIAGFGCYIGTTSNPKKRQKDHIAEARMRRRDNVSRGTWIRSLLARGLEPELQVLEWTDDPTAEARWITRYRASGMATLNVTPDGKGIAGAGKRYS